jgi:alpha-1,2-mannosyltransferase
VVNQPYSKIIDCFKESWVGIHTMEAEHFGISVVEMLAAGLIVVAHNSAGPKLDIIKDPQYLAETKEDYIRKITAIVESPEQELRQISDANRKKALNYSEQKFQ